MNLNIYGNCEVDYIPNSAITKFGNRYLGEGDVKFPRFAEDSAWEKTNFYQELI